MSNNRAAAHQPQWAQTCGFMRLRAFFYYPFTPCEIPERNTCGFNDKREITDQTTQPASISHVYLLKSFCQ